MTGLPSYNFQRFADEANRLRTEDLYVFNPAEHDIQSGFNPIGLTGFESKEELATLGFHLRDALTADLEFIGQHADYVVVLPGWEKSKGVAAEIALADALGIPVAKAGTMFVDHKYNDVEYDLLRSEEPTPTYYSGGIIQPEGLENLKKLATNYKNGAEEVRTTSATGGQKGKKLASLSALDPHSLTVVAEVAGFGASKYSKLNFMKGYDWSLSYDALQRHLSAFWNGEDRDDESGMLHLGHAAWHCLAMISFVERGLGTDDRYTSTPELCDLQTKTIG